TKNLHTFYYIILRMNIVRYAPSGRFTLIALSILLAAGLIYGAELATSPVKNTAHVEADQTATQNSNAENWQEALYAIQAQNASSTLGGPNQATVGQMLQSAQSG